MKNIDFRFFKFLQGQGVYTHPFSYIKSHKMDDLSLALSEISGYITEILPPNKPFIECQQNVSLD